jgi:hypothetical protein
MFEPDEPSRWGIDTALLDWYNHPILFDLQASMRSFI